MGGETEGLTLFFVVWSALMFSGWAGGGGLRQKVLYRYGCILLRLKSQSARGASHHSASMDSCPTFGHTFSALPAQWMSSPLRK